MSLALARSGRGTALYALTVFLGAFLLFQVQPLIAKIILPWFGGSPAVWITCMLFFQLALLVGYCYAHLITSWLGSRGQVILHLALLAASLALLPITPDAAWKPTQGTDPTLRILALLASCIGAPFMLLSSTGPLLQRWFSRVHPGKSPYRLYAVSNIGSLLALLTYPLLFEPALRLHSQTRMWSLGHLAFALLCGVCAWRLWKHSEDSPTDDSREDASRLETHEVVDADEGPAMGDTKPGVLVIAMWLALSTTGSIILLATTNQLTQSLAPVPFLWILPLAIYLITFILCFDVDRWYRPDVFLWVLVVGLISTAIVTKAGPEMGLGLQVGLYSLILFSCCMTCHGELVRLRPAPSHLTLFYLMLACGGALGGIFVTLLAPLVFDSFLEFNLGIILCCALMFVARRLDAVQRVLLRSLSNTRSLALASAVAIATLSIAYAVFLLGRQVYLDGQGVIAMTRDFYGVLHVTVENRNDPDTYSLRLAHGSIRHGSQFRTPEKRMIPTTYYDYDSGVGVAIDVMRRSRDERLRIGVVGLGVGTIGTYANRGDYLRFYEISPKVAELANAYFTYQKDAAERGADVGVFVGDARIVMERQLASGHAQSLDVLVLDAFSGDAVPVHLLTEECFALYWKHLKADGLLAVHISNRYLDLSRVVRALASIQGRTAWRVDGGQDAKRATVKSSWVIVTADPRMAGVFDNDPARRWPADAPKPLLWTDDFSSLFDVLK